MKEKIAVRCLLNIQLAHENTEAKNKKQWSTDDNAEVEEAKDFFQFILTVV